MDRLLSAVRRFLKTFAAETPVDGLASLSPRDYADLPIYHPVLDACAFTPRSREWL